MKTSQTSVVKRRAQTQYSRSKFRNTLNFCIMDILESIDTPLSLALAISYRNSNYTAVDLSLLKERDPACFNEAYPLQVHKQTIALFKKSTYIAYEGDAMSESIAHFKDVDAGCLLSDNLITSASFNLRSVLNEAALIIESVLGTEPCYDAIFKDLAFTSGSVSGISGSDVNIVTKLDMSQLPLSRGAKPIFSFYLQGKEPLLQTIYPTTVDTDYSELFTVPKQYNKVRVAAKSQLGNMLLQRPIGVYIGKRLKQRCGIDLSSQQEFHGFLVERFHDVIATLDQSDASDRICVELCKALLPYDWFRLLNLTRHRYLKHNGTVFPMHKFANQGNGFIFELQTLIYYALAKATVTYYHGKKKADRMILSVFGDDMILDAIYAPAVAETLVNVGQAINFEKSYMSGRFKESCGIDTYDGINIRPIYIKQFSYGLRGYYELSNFISSIYRSIFSASCADLLCVRAYVRCLSAVENKHLAFGPAHLGDATISVSWSSLNEFVKKFKGCRHGYYKRGQLRQPQLVNTQQGRSVEWLDEWFKRPSASRHGRNDECSIMELSQLLVYALLGNDSEGTLSRGAPVKYSFQTTVSHWDADRVW